ncbi:hypothetical protein ACWGII_39670 [Streptomyces sp. NPDC054855]
MPDAVNTASAAMVGRPEDRTPDGKPRPTLYDHFDYKGTAAWLEEGSYTALDDKAVADDALSSVKTPAGWKVTLYTDRYLKGRSLTLTSDTPRLAAEFNDKVSSITVARV